MARLLVVDGDLAVLSFVSDVTESVGWLVARAVCGRAAGEFLSTTTFDTVLADLRLSDMAAIELIRQVPIQTTRFIVMARDGSVRSAVELIKAGAHDYLEKPFGATALLASLRD